MTSNLTESHQLAQQGSLEWSAFRLRLELGFHQTSPVLAAHGLASYPEHSVDLHLLSLQLTVPVQYSVPMRLVLDDPFVLFPLRRNPSFVVLHAQHGLDTQDLPGLLPRSWSDNPENVPSLYGCETISCILHPDVYPNFFRISCEILCSLALGVHQQARVVVHPDSVSDAEHLPEGGHGEPLIASKPSNVASSGIAFAALDLISRPSPFRSTMCSSVWKRFSSPVPRCHLSVMTPSGTFPSIQPFIRRFTITRLMAFVQNVRGMFNNPRKHRRVNGDGTPRLDSKDQKESLLSSPQLT